MWDWRFGQRDALHTEGFTKRRMARLTQMAAEPWPRLLLRIALQLLALFAAAALLVALLGR